MISLHLKYLFLLAMINNVNQVKNLTVVAIFKNSHRVSKQQFKMNPLKLMITT